MLILELVKKLSINTGETYRAYRSKINNRIVSVRIYERINKPTHIVAEIFNGEEAIGENVVYGAINSDIDTVLENLSAMMEMNVELMD